jgi:hypothetical protein
VKITVIATGFGAQPSARTSTAMAQTPIDMTPYSDAARMRIEMPTMAAPARRQASPPVRRRVELPLGGGVSAMQGGVLPLNPRNGDALLDGTDADAANAAFDVPAFLRRQDG